MLGAGACKASRKHGVQHSEADIEDSLKTSATLVEGLLRCGSEGSHVTASRGFD